MFLLSLKKRSPFGLIMFIQSIELSDAVIQIYCGLTHICVSQGVFTGSLKIAKVVPELKQ